MRKQRILAIHRYYWPDIAPYASILRAICESEAQSGQYEVEVFVGRPGYRGVVHDKQPISGRLNGVLVRRIWLLREGNILVRFLNSSWMAVRVVWRAVWLRPDVIIASTAPPFFLSSAAALAARLTGARFIYHCMDIHPELGHVSGEFRHRWLLQLLTRVDTWICMSASRVIVLSNAMKTSLLEARSGLDSATVVVMNNPALPIYDQMSDAERDWVDIFRRDESVKIVFAGNIGRFQALESLIDAAAALPAESSVRLYFIGSGKMRNVLELRAKEKCPNRIVFKDQVSAAAVNEAIAHAAAGIVSVQNGVDQYAFPSKLTNYIAQGCPVLAITAPDAPIASFVSEQRLGWVAIQGDVNNIAAALHVIATTDHKEMREHVLSTYMGNYAMSLYLTNWSRLIAECLT